MDLWKSLVAGGVLLTGVAAMALAVEAETGRSDTKRIRIETRKDASGGRLVRLQGAVRLKNPPKPDTPADLVIPLSVEKTGGYDILLRFYAPDGGSDSFYYTVNQEPVGEMHTGTHADGAEISLGTVRLEKGSNVLKFWTREPRLGVDSVTLTPGKMPLGKPITLQAEAARFPADRVEVVDQPKFAGGKGLALKSGVKPQSGTPGGTPDLSFEVTLPEGRYQIRTVTSATPEKYREILNLSKTASLRVDVAVGDQLKQRLCAFSPWQPREYARNTLGKFNFSGGKDTVKIWLPEGMALDEITIVPYTPPAIPPAVTAYVPKYLPPKDRPRILVTRELLPEIKANLNLGENREFWKQIQRLAEKPYKFTPPESGSIDYDARLETAARNKAFVYLMTGNTALGKEAVKLTRDYLRCVEFGNMLDITREIGRAIYSAALVYDWCYDLMTPEDRQSIRENMMRLADDMEIGWPPFLQNIVNGHGNEHQISRDLFSMAVAIYDEDPEPYRICIYRMLEELSPMHTFEYSGGRHNQGMSYGLSRFTCDMLAAWNIKRTLGLDLFGDGAKKVPYAWIYMRLPDGTLMRDGDDFIAYQQRGKYWSNPMTAFLCHTYAGDPILKGDYERQAASWGRMEPLLFLLLNDPKIKAEPDRSSLPLTHYMPEPYPAMVARTGWDFGKDANDAIVYLTGGGFQSGNHQHLNAGDFQIYYRGMLAADLGTYRFYGTPYDMKFNKRSVSHNVMLFRTPAKNDDGGQVYHSGSPNSLKELLEKTRNGRMLAAAFGPSAVRPFFSVFKTDTAPGYARGRLKSNIRNFVVLNLGDPRRPMAVIVLDAVVPQATGLTPHWPLNSWGKPSIAEPGRIVVDTLDGEGRLTLNTLLPAADELNVTTATGKETYNVFGTQYEAPFTELEEVNGSRTVFSLKKPVNGPFTFLNVMQLTRNAPGVEALPVKLSEADGACTVQLDHHTVNLARDGQNRTRELVVPVAGAVGRQQVLITDLAPGNWLVRNADTGKILGAATVKADDGTLFFIADPGKYRITPHAATNAPALPDYSREEAPMEKPTSVNGRPR